VNVSLATVDMAEQLMDVHLLARRDDRIDVPVAEGMAVE
jgi:hypothetical protein